MRRRPFSIGLSVELRLARTELRSRMNAEFFVDARKGRLDRLGADRQLRGNVAVRHSARSKPRDGAFARRDPSVCWLQAEPLAFRSGSSCPRLCAGINE